MQKGGHIKHILIILLTFNISCISTEFKNQGKKNKDEEMTHKSSTVITTNTTEQLKILNETLNIANDIRINLIEKYIPVFSVKSPHSEKYKELDDKFTSILQAAQDNKYLSPEKAFSVFEQSQAHKVQAAYDEFNQRVYPFLQQGVSEKDKNKVLQGLKNWKANNTRWIKLATTRINALKNKDSATKRKKASVKKQSRKGFLMRKAPRAEIPRLSGF